MLTIRLGIKHFFAIQRLSFRAMGIDVTSLELTFKHPLLFGYITFAFGLYLCANLNYYLTTIYDDVNELTFDLLPFAQYVIITGKICIFVYKRKEFVILIQRIHQMTKQASNEERLLIDIANKTDQIFCGTFCTNVVIFIIGVCIVPPIISLVVYINHGYLRSLNPMKFSIPLDESQPLYFFLGVVWFTSAMWFGGLCTTSMDTLFAWIVHNIAAQFHVLRCKFQNAALETDTEKMKDAISACIEHHQNVIALANDLNDIYRMIVFMEFSLKSVPVCLLAYQVGNGIAAENLLYVVPYLAGVLFQMLIYCYGGQLIQDESTIISTHIYEIFPWERLEIHLRKSLLLSILRAQKSCKINGYLFVADWKLFQWVVRSAYSMVALLRSMDAHDAL